MSADRDYQGGTISEPGIWRGIPLATYHGDRALFDGPSVSKSILPWLIPVHNGSPKAFWGRWLWNPKRIETKTTKALDFGRATHSLLLGDEPFWDNFAVRPDKAPDGREWHGANKSCKEWMAEREHLTIITSDDYKRIKAMERDAAEHPLVAGGILNGRVERTLCVKDPETGIWLRVRPDAMPKRDGVYADLKTTSRMNERFIERQIGDCGYYLQGAMTRMVCRLLGLPFEYFAFVFVLNDDVPDTEVVALSAHDLDRGERVITWCLRTIRRCLDSGEWPGYRPFNGGGSDVQMNEWSKKTIDDFLEREESSE